MNPQTDWPTLDEERDFLTRLNTNIRTAQEEIAVRYHPLLLNFLMRTFPRAGEDLRGEAADRALIDFLDSPDHFDPARGGLGAYLRMSARRDLMNLLKSEARARRGIPLDSVAEPVDCRNQMRDGGELTWEHPRLVAECSALDPNERAAFDLMREGVRDTATFARRLGLAHLSAGEQARAVKRAKDRLMKRFSRAVEDLR